MLLMPVELQPYVTYGEEGLIVKDLPAELEKEFERFKTAYDEVHNINNLIDY